MIRIITGGIGSGKLLKCLKEIEETHGMYPNAKCLMLVNEHNSHETERVFNEYFGGTGLNNIEVTTFRKLSGELLNRDKLRTMNAVGQQMLLKKTVDEYIGTEPDINGNLRRAVCRDGFIDVLSQMIGEMKNYSVGAEEMRTAAEVHNENKVLSQKLNAMADMYEIYTKNFEKLDYTDAQDLLDILADAIKASDYFDSTYMWIDKFDELLPQQMKVIEALHSKVKQLTVSIAYPASTIEQPLYSEIERTLRKIEGLDEKREYIDCGEQFKNIYSHEIKYLAENWNGSVPYNGEAKDIKLTACSDLYSEIELAAGRITDLVREDNYRFRDIAVICGKESDYSYLVDTVFDEYKIPVFTDAKISLSNHPTALQILSVFDMFENDFDYESVFEYLKAGFIYRESEGKMYPVLSEAIDELENFVIKYAIRGKSRWFSTRAWTTKNTISNIVSDNERAKDTEEAERINILRQELVKPLRKYEKASSGMISGMAHAEALYNLLDDINLYSGLKAEIQRLANSGKIDEADEFEQIWELILEVLDQLVISVGECDMDRETFGTYIRAGISKCEITTIPSGIDKVYFGTAERNAPADVRALFIIGASSGTFPDEMGSEGFFSNADRNAIKDIVPLAPDTMGRMSKRRYNVFKTVTSATEKLFVSYSANDVSSNEQGPSRMINDIQRKFPKLTVENYIETENNYAVYIASPEVTVHRLLTHRNTDNPVWNTVYSYFKEKDIYPEFIDMLEKGRTIAKSYDTISPDDACGMYGDGQVEYSANKLNTYAKCPYMYFLKYGLGISKREEWDISSVDIGLYAHSIIENFCRAVECGETDINKKAQKWHELSDDVREKILEELFKEAEDKLNESDMSRQGKALNIMKRMERVIGDAAEVVHASLKYGKYTIVEEEKNFNIDLNDKVKLQGFIDRFDICEADKYTGIRIIDYKTGRNVFDINNILNGVDMQMVLYAAAIKKIYSKKNPDRDYRITGIYYNRVGSKNVKTKINDAVMPKVMKKLDGMTFIESEDNYDALYDIDERMKDGEASDFLDVKFTKKGISAWSKVKTFDYGEKLMERVEETAAGYDEEIRDKGSIKQQPYEDSCKHCDYIEMCRIFGEKEQRKKENLSLEEGDE